MSDWSNSYNELAESLHSASTRELKMVFKVLNAPPEALDIIEVVVAGAMCDNCARNGVTCYPVVGSEAPECWFCTSWLAKPKPCPDCGGRGEKTHIVTYDGHGQKFPCVKCHGTGVAHD